MSEYVSLTCPACGGRLEITSDVERFACAHCGREQLVRRAGGVVSLELAVEELQRIQASADRIAANMARVSLAEEIRDAAAAIVVARQAQTAARIHYQSNLKAATIVYAIPSLLLGAAGLGLAVALPIVGLIGTALVWLVILAGWFGLRFWLGRDYARAQLEFQAKESNYQRLRKVRDQA